MKVIIFKPLRAVEVMEGQTTIGVMIPEIKSNEKFGPRDFAEIESSKRAILFPGEETRTKRVNFFQVRLPILRDPETKIGFAFESPEYNNSIQGLLAYARSLETKIAELEKPKSIIIPGRG